MRRRGHRARQRQLRRLLPASANKGDTLKDTWNMVGFNPAEHEGAAGGAWITPWLLEQYGPLTEISPKTKRQGGGT